MVKSIRRPGATAMLTDFARSARPGAPVIEKASAAILDTVAVIVAGSVQPSVRALSATLGHAGDAADARVLWSRSTSTGEDAALVTGTASHVLDFDDVSMLAVCHPSAPIVSALLCSRSWENLDARGFLEAFAIGTEVLVRLGMAMGFVHYAIGFHATSTLGAVGAAAACARIDGFGEAQTRNAMAIAASMAGGIRANFGTSVKSLHVGLAASTGIKAARLARGGMAGAEEAFEHSGFLSAFTGGRIDEWSEDVRLGEPFAIDEPGFERKAYPCCYMLHRMIAATLALRTDHDVDLESVAGIHVDMPAGGTKPLIHPFPKTGMNALFSAPYVILASLKDGRIDLDSFTDQQVMRADIQARLSVVSVVEREGEASEGRDIGDAPVTVTITLKSGVTLRKTIHHNPGSPAAPLTDKQFSDKWKSCLKRGGSLCDVENAHLLAAGFDVFRGHGDLPQWLFAVRESMSKRRTAS